MSSLRRARLLLFLKTLTLGLVVGIDVHEGLRFIWPDIMEVRLFRTLVFVAIQVTFMVYVSSGLERLKSEDLD